MGRRSDRVQEYFSGIDRREAVDFEITFAALIATLSLTFPLPSYPIVSQGAAFAVLAMTLIRRMVLLSPFVDDEDGARKSWIMGWTIPFFEFTSVFAILLLFIRLSKYLHLQGFGAIFYWVGAAFSVLLIACIQEILFRDELLWWYKKFIEKYERSNDSGFWLYLSAQSWDLSRAPIANSGSGRFRFGPPAGEDDYSFWDGLRYLGKGSWFFFLGAGILFIFSYLLLGPMGVGMVLTASMVRDQVRFWLAAYGNGSFEQLAGPWYRTYIAVFIYIGTAYTLL